MKKLLILMLVWTLIGFLAGMIVLKLWYGNERITWTDRGSTAQYSSIGYV